MIEVKEASFSYNHKEVLSKISFNIKKGERIVLLGSNGCGKTTLLKILNGLLFFQEGEYYYKDEKINKKILKDLEFSKRFRKSNVMLFQSPDVMIFNPTVFDEISFSLRQIGKMESEIKEITLKWAKILGIENYLDLPPFELSGGEKQKVILASILSIEPETILLDEPMANLDPKTQGFIIDLLWELPVTSIISTHNLNLAPELGERAILMSEDHKIIYDGEIDKLIQAEEILIKANLIHEHRHKHKGLTHSHYHKH